MKTLQFGSFKKKVEKALKENNNLRIEVYLEYDGWIDITFNLNDEENLKRLYDATKHSSKTRFINVICEF